ncbi:terminase large subunit [Caloranaerobacter ferrireducens]|uniref:terminase large subunit n=1 Tax=Caloranaerobacter ferrireducens TaxID=1323370 RepID=UPI00114CCBB5|nr:terminase large subunit [Caloranaerobacter ferrireducens]
MKSYSDSVTQYCYDVLEGKEIAGELVKLACKRHLRDLDRQGAEEFPYIFIPEKAERVFKFFSFCKHTKGKLAGQPINLEPFQKFIIGSIFGWVHKDTGLRRYRKAYVQLGRKNGKSTILSGTGLYMLMADGEEGAEIYSTATKKDQAKIVYDDAKNMVIRSKDLSKRLKPNRDMIYHEKTNSKFVPLSKDTKSLDGLSPYLGIIDEYHAHPTPEMYDVIVSGMGQRTQPLLFIITTAGFELNYPCYKEYKYCCQLLDGTLKNEEYFVYIAQLDKNDDYRDANVWIKANPLLAKTEEGMNYLRGELKIALDMPEKLRNFLTKNMNIWVDEKDNGYMDMKKWRACNKELPNLEGKECIVGVDLSSKIDLTSVTAEFPLENGEYAIISHSFIPENAIRTKEIKDKVPYSLWIKQGYITATPGDIVDYEFVKQYIRDLNVKYKVKEICFDPWNATQFATDMMNEGFECVEIRQGYKTLSEPTKNIRELVYQGKIIHGNNPVLTWAVSNAVTKQDPNENIMLDKAKSTNRIDPIASLINAHSRAMLYMREKDVNEHILSDDFSF